jgi:hypothetical protein
MTKVIQQKLQTAPTLHNLCLGLQERRDNRDEQYEALKDLFGHWSDAQINNLIDISPAVASLPDPIFGWVEGKHIGLMCADLTPLGYSIILVSKNGGKSWVTPTSGIRVPFKEKIPMYRRKG